MKTKIDIRMLLRKKDELLAKRQEILDKAVEENRGYTEEERTKAKDLQGQIAAFDEQIREAEEIEAQRAGSAERHQAAGQSQEEPGDERTKFRNLGDFIRDIWNASRGNHSERILAFRQRMEQQLRAMNISDGASLGYLIPDQFEAGTLQLTGQGGRIRQYARVVPAGEYPDAKFKKRVLRQGQAGAYYGILFNWTSEGVAPVDESKLTYDLFVLDPSDKKLAGFYITSQESLQNPTAVTADMEMSFRGGLAEYEDELFLTGDGAGKPRGILKSPGRYEIARKTSAKFQFDDVLQMAKHSYPRATARRWAISLDLYEQVAGMVDGNGRYIMIAGDATKGMPDMLHGRPIDWSEVQPGAGDAGDAILADWSYYVIKDGSGPYFATDPYSRFMEDEIKVKMITKFDGDSWVKEPLKLKNGLVVSPFIVLK